MLVDPTLLLIIGSPMILAYDLFFRGAIADACTATESDQHPEGEALWI